MIYMQSRELAVSPLVCGEVYTAAAHGVCDSEDGLHVFDIIVRVNVDLDETFDFAVFILRQIGVSCQRMTVEIERHVFPDGQFDHVPGVSRQRTYIQIQVCLQAYDGVFTRKQRFRVRVHRSERGLQIFPRIYVIDRDVFTIDLI